MVVPAGVDPHMVPVPAAQFVPPTAAGKYQDESQVTSLRRRDMVWNKLVSCVSTQQRVALPTTAVPRPLSVYSPLIVKANSLSPVAMSPVVSSANDWWSDADASISRLFDSMSTVFTLVKVRTVRHTKSEKYTLPESSGALYEEMGAVLPDTGYVAVWLNMDKMSLLFLCKAKDSDSEHFTRCFTGDYLKERSKFIISPVSISLPFPATHPKDGQTIGKFFGSSGSSSTQCSTPSGATVHCIRIDIFSLFLLRTAIKSVGFRPGNVLDLFIVDWEERAIFAGCRLAVTSEFVRQGAGAF
jgi:hypothetical protein